VYSRKSATKYVNQTIETTKGTKVQGLTMAHFSKKQFEELLRCELLAH
jgi:hypothetical protein